MEMKKQYTVKVEVLAPIELTYKVWAESAEEALKNYERSSLSQPPKPILSKKKTKKVVVYKYGTTLIELTKKY